MSYPEPRYVGDKGSTSAELRRSDVPPELTMTSVDVSYLATGATTDGAFGLYRWDMGAQPRGATPHFHRTISESFFVLTGAVRLFDGTGWADAAPGDFLHVPVGGVHGFRNESGEPASMLILFTPGAPRERYFEALAAMAASGQELDDEARVDFLRSRDQYDA